VFDCVEVNFQLGLDAVDVHLSEFGLFIFFGSGQNTVALFGSQFVNSGYEFRSYHRCHLIYI